LLLWREPVIEGSIDSPHPVARPLVTRSRAMQKCSRHFRVRAPEFKEPASGGFFAFVARTGYRRFDTLATSCASPSGPRDAKMLPTFSGSGTLFKMNGPPRRSVFFASCLCHLYPVSRPLPYRYAILPLSSVRHDSDNLWTAPQFFPLCSLLWTYQLCQRPSWPGSGDHAICHRHWACWLFFVRASPILSDSPEWFF